MIITLPSGDYLRPGLAKVEEAEWFFEVMADWPTGGWGLNRCQRQLSKSVANCPEAKIVSRETFSGLILIYNLVDNTRIGVSRVNYYSGSPSGFQVDFAAIHPNHRGRGHFTEMSEAIAYFANQILQADEAVYQVLDTAPQVMSRTVTLGGKVGKEGKGRVEVKLTREKTESVLSETAKNSRMVRHVQNPQQHIPPDVSNPSG